MTATLRSLCVCAYLAWVRLTERVEREEATYEHGVTELSVEWEHLVYQVPTVVGTCRGWFP